MNPRFSLVLIPLLHLFTGCDATRPQPQPQQTTQAKSKEIRPLRIPSIVEEPAPPPSIPSFIELSKSSLPTFWLRSAAIQDSTKSIVAIRHQQWVDQRRPDGSRFISISWQSPLEHAKKQEILGSLKLNKKPNTLDGEWQRQGKRAWRLQDDPERGKVTLEWQRDSAFSPQSERRCGRPHHIAPPLNLPKTLRALMTKTTTRRTISVSDEISRTQHNISLMIWYKNGFAQDEHIGMLQNRLRAQKWVKQHGNSVKQSWWNSDHGHLSWYPVREAFPMGCSLRGPLIQFTWSQAQ